jgi:FtsZ-interacting cell division protein ZipA
MTIAFIGVAVVALIFLLVFNTKMARKSSPKARQADEDSRQRSKRPYPVQVEPEIRELPDHAGEAQHKAADASEHHAGEYHKVPDIHADVKLERERRDHQDAYRDTDQDTYDDQNYRAALRGFAGKSEEKDGRSQIIHGENESPKSEDEQYREALRSMNRKK